MEKVRVPSNSLEVYLPKVFIHSSITIRDFPSTNLVWFTTKDVRDKCMELKQEKLYFDKHLTRSNSRLH